MSNRFTLLLLQLADWVTDHREKLAGWITVAMLLVIYPVPLLIWWFWIGGDPKWADPRTFLIIPLAIWPLIADRWQAIARMIGVSQEELRGEWTFNWWRAYWFMVSVYALYMLAVDYGWGENDFNPTTFAISTIKIITLLTVAWLIYKVLYVPKWFGDPDLATNKVRVATYSTWYRAPEMLLQSSQRSGPIAVTLAAIFVVLPVLWLVWPLVVIYFQGDLVGLLTEPVFLPGVWLYAFLDEGLQLPGSFLLVWLEYYLGGGVAMCFGFWVIWFLVKFRRTGMALTRDNKLTVCVPKGWFGVFSTDLYDLSKIVSTTRETTSLGDIGVYDPTTATKADRIIAFHIPRSFLQEVEQVRAAVTAKK